MKHTVLESILKLYSEIDQERIVYAYEFALKAIGDKKRENNRPFIDHPIGTAKIVAIEMGLDADSVVLVFIHESLRFHPELEATISSKYVSKEVLDMANALNKIAFLNIKDLEKKPTNKDEEKKKKDNEDNYKHLIVSYSSDPRATLVKIADRLDVMRNLKLLPKSKQDKKNDETMLLYVPIIHQLGLYKIKSELEEICFRYTDKEMYRLISNKLKATQRDRDKVAEEFIIPLEKELKDKGLDFVIKARTKTAYSIAQKMKRQEVPFEGVFDILALRIIINNPEYPDYFSVAKEDSRAMINSDHSLCWDAYSVVTRKYVPNTKRLRNWLSNPKSNGYESLHITVSNEKGVETEVQIRTKRMDDIAENGFASHWSYKGIEGKVGLNQWLQSVRDILESGDSGSYEHNSQFINENVFVFTPNGDLIRLKAGASVLDFAFSIHSNLGVKCSGAKIDGKVVSIREKLKTGDVVDVIKNNNQKPSADWLNYAVTTKARTKIKQKIKEEETKSANLGKELLNRRLKNWKLEMLDEDVMALAKKYKCKTVNEFFSLIEQEKVDVQIVKDYLKAKLDAHSNDNTSGNVEEQPAFISNTNTSKDAGGDYIVLDGKLNNLSYKLSKCCNPIFGDDVFGFVSIKEGIKIHRMSCPNAARLIENYPYRIQKVKWRSDANSVGFDVALKIVAEESSSYASVITYISSNNITLRSSNMQERVGGDRGYSIRLQISVSDDSHLKKIITGLHRIKGIGNVLRV